MADKDGLTNDNGGLNRRSYLRAAGVAATGASALGGRVAARTAGEYDRVVNIVEAGADNTGRRPIDEVLGRYARDDTLIEFPNGRYRIDQQSLYRRTNFGMVAVGDDVTLVPNSQQDYWIAGGEMRDFRFEGFTIDCRASGIHPMMSFGVRDGLVFRDVEKVGVHDGYNEAFGFSILDADGSGLVENLRLADGSVHDGYNDSGYAYAATGIYVGTTGAITFRDCHVEGFGDNGLYASVSDGPVRVEGGTFKNNDVAQVRLGSDGSYVRGATIAVDDDLSDNAANARGIRICDGPYGVRRRVLVEDCDIVMEGGHGFGGVVGAYTGGAFTVRNSRIHVDDGYTYPGTNRSSHAVYADRTSGNDGAGRVILEDVSVTGDAADRVALKFQNRSAVIVRNVCVEQTAGDRDGIRFNGGWNNRVEGSTLNVAGRAVIDNDGHVSASGLSYGGDCPLPTGFARTSAGGSFSVADAPIPPNAKHLTFGYTGKATDKPLLAVYGNPLAPRTQKFIREKLPVLGERFIEPGYMGVQLRMVSRDLRYEDAPPKASYAARVGLSLWDMEPGKYWPYLAHLAEVQPAPEEFDYVTARDLLKDVGVKYYGWIPARADEFYDQLSWSNAGAENAGATRTGQGTWNGTLLNCLSSGLEDYLGNRV